MAWLASGTGPVTPAEATEMLRSVVGSSFPALVVSRGDVLLPFGPEVAIALEGQIRTADDAPGVEAPTPDGLGLLLPLIDVTVTDATAHEGGGLTLVLGSTTLHCAGDPYYEPWRMTDEAGQQLTSTPGGGYVVTT